LAGVDAMIRQVIKAHGKMLAFILITPFSVEAKGQTLNES
jgi:hypothetical protein